MTISPIRRYCRLWRTVPRDLGFLLALLPIIITGFVVSFTVTISGLALVIVWVGVPVLAGGLLTARWFGTFELSRLAAARQNNVRRPQWADLSGKAGFLRNIRLILLDGRYWLYFLYTSIVNFAVGLFTWIVTFTWITVSCGGLTYWAWNQFVSRPSGEENIWLHVIVFRLIDPSFQPASAYSGLVAGESLFLAVCSLLLLLTMPIVTRGLVFLHASIARAMLGEWRSVDLKRKIAAAESSRGSAVLAEDNSLRRLERDIHDGPQQRLIRLQYDLASAERKFDIDPAGARVLMTGALQQSKDTLDELRELSRGLAPPILQDRGLVAAISSLATRSTVPVTTVFDLDTGTSLLSEVERSAYFIVSELITNTAKHAAASAASITLSIEPSMGRSEALTLVVTDDGSGGAILKPGHGLSGLNDRIAGLRGALTISSPAGGPTTITVQIPLGYSEAFHS